jgi:endonuclease YncB( thermonuclease family)
MSTEWTVPCTVISVHDGDTLTVQLDLGWKIFHSVVVRVAHIDAPELSTPEGVQASDFAKTLLPVGEVLTITSHKLDKYGRSLASLELPSKKDFGVEMMAAGHAKPYEGGAR